jgi:hypothetical protein
MSLTLLVSALSISFLPSNFLFLAHFSMTITQFLIRIPSPIKSSFSSTSSLQPDLTEDSVICIHTHIFARPLTTYKILKVIPERKLKAHIRGDDDSHPLDSNDVDNEFSVIQEDDSITYAGHVPPGEVIVKCAVAVFGRAPRPGIIRVVVDCGVREELQRVVRPVLSIDTSVNHKIDVPARETVLSYL